MSYVQPQSMLDLAFPPGPGFLRRLEDAAIEALVSFAATKPSPQTSIALQQMHGAASRVGAAETAVAHCQDQYDFLILSMWPDPADAEKNTRWTRELYGAMQLFLGRGAYVNNLGEEDGDRVHATYGSNYERLTALKNTYDSANFLRLNHYVEPVAGAEAPTPSAGFCYLQGLAGEPAPSKARVAASQ